MKTSTIITISIIVLVFLLKAIFLSPSESQSYNKELPAPPVYDQFSKVKEPHWTHMPLTYKIINQESCDSLELNEINQSFSKIENITEGYIRFQKTDSNADLNITCVSTKEEVEKQKIEIQNKYGSLSFCENLTYGEKLKDLAIWEITSYKEIKDDNGKILYYQYCYDISKDITKDSFFQGKIGEALPDMTSNQISHGNIWMYKEGEGWTSCTDFPVSAVHEILHNFGLDHTNFSEYSKTALEELKQMSSIMAPYRFCRFQKTIDSDIVSCLKKIYSNNQFNGTCSNVPFFPYCPARHVWGQDNQCHPQCGEGYCPDNSKCCNNQCLSCPEGSYLDSTCNCRSY